MIITISKGLQITIPADIREELKLEVGSRVELTKANGKIILQPLGEDLKKLFKQAKQIKPKYKLTARQMDELIEHEILRQ